MNLLVLLLPFVTVDAFLRPIHHFYSGGDGSGEATTTSDSSSTMRWNYVCESGWHKFERTSSQYNGNTGIWCVKLIPSETAISVNNGSALCEQEDAILTIFESEEERSRILAEAQSHIIDHLKRPSGAIALAGKLIKECITTNETVLDGLLKGPPCNDVTKVFTLPSSSGTNPEFLWKNWAEREPSHNLWTYDIEDCLQMFVKPSNNGTHGKINDFYCVFNAAPNQLENPDYMNFGALCGKQPDIESF